MSCTLYWRPSQGGTAVGGSQLRDAVMSEFRDGAVLDSGSLPFLRGLAAAKVEGARELIEAIEKHDDIEIYLEC